MLLEKDDYIKEFEKIPLKELKQIDLIYKKVQLNQQRNKELQGFIINNIFINQSFIKTMKVELDLTEDSEDVEWIDIDNQIVSFTKDEFRILIKQGSQKVKEIYFKYRRLKDDLLNS